MRVEDGITSPPGELSENGFFLKPLVNIEIFPLNKKKIIDEFENLAA